jgi:hypothetical protein
MKNKSDLKISATLLCLYALLGIVSYSILGAIFDFPEILRKPITERFALFHLHEAVIIPTYYAFALTGVLQILFSIYLFKIIDSKSSNGLVGLTFGILAGLCQTFGFIRWVVAIPYLTSLSKTTDVSTFEGLLNSYFGMSIGEHLGSLFLAIWLVYIFLSMRETKLFDNRLANIALFSGLLMLPVAFEPLGSGFSPFAILSIPVYGLVITWMLLIAFSLFKYKDEVVIIKWHIWLIAFLFWLVNITPAFM